MNVFVVVGPDDEIVAVYASQQTADQHADRQTYPVLTVERHPVLTSLREY